jgi:hypothetical protein
VNAVANDQRRDFACEGDVDETDVVARVGGVVHSADLLFENREAQSIRSKWVAQDSIS